MTQLPFHAAMVVFTMVLFVATLALNEWLFSGLEFVKGINWIYLPAGVRLLSTLLFGASGALGLLLVSWLVSFVYFFPNDPWRAFAGGILAATGPFLVYRLAQRMYGLQATLANLSPRRLLWLILAYSLASPGLHHIWFVLSSDPSNLLSGFSIMFIGDLPGTLIVIYAMKAVLWVHSTRKHLNH